MIPYGRQLIDDDDIAAVVDVLKGDWLTQGPNVERFEKTLAVTVEARFAIAFSSGTAALHAATTAADLGPGDVVSTSPLSFVASANCIRYVGATVAFVDIDPTTLNLDPAQVPHSAAGLIAIHYAGLPVDLSLLAYRPRVVIEDAAHALGARTPDGPVGNCARSDMCVFSFHPVKAITTGEGGAVTTNDPVAADRLRRFRSHGMVHNPLAGGWHYEVDTLGFNYRLTDIQAALGTSQLSKLDRFVARRTALADRYRRLLADFPLKLPPEAGPGTTHAYHLFPVQVENRRQVYEGLREKGIAGQVHYVPIYHHPLYDDLGIDPAHFPAAERAYAGLLSLPLFPALTDQEQDRAVAALQELIT